MKDDPDLADIAEEHPSIYRQCAERFLPILHAAVARMPDCVEKWGIAFATSNPVCLGRSMTEIADKLGVCRATISAEARKFCDDHGLPPSPYMKSEQAVTIAQETRRLAIHIRETNQKRKQ